MRRIFLALIVALTHEVAAMPNAEAPDKPSSTPLVSFQGPAEPQAWRTVNDNVMGGRSSGGAAVADAQLVFSGTLNTRGGGFSSVRRTLSEGALKGGKALTLSVKSDARAYRLIARTDARFLGRHVSYQAAIPPGPSGEWTLLQVPFTDFVPTIFGRRVPAAPFDPAQVNEFGFIIADGLDGPFSIRVRSIRLER